MSFLHPSIFYVYLRTFWDTFRLNVLEHFSLRRMSITLLLLSVLPIFWVVVTMFRLVDEVLFFGYRNVEVEAPVFIISNPRSGTTYMHRLMCLDQEHFAYTLLWHTLLPSISFIKLIQSFGWVDARLGGFARKFFDWVDRKAFGGWADIHPMGVNKSEEDEGLYFMSGMSPAIGLVCPWFGQLRDIQFPDLMQGPAAKRFMKFYVNTVRRYLYALGRDRRYLCKSVMSTGRLQLLLDEFPDARIIYLIRSPYEAVPSFASMFTAPYPVFSPDISKTDPQSADWCRLGIDYYRYFFDQRKVIPQENLITVLYDELTEQPKETVLRVYEHFGMEVSPSLREQLDKITVRTKGYQSKHDYSLEQFGMSAADVYEPLADVFEEFGFDRTPSAPTERRSSDVPPRAVGDDR